MCHEQKEARHGVVRDGQGSGSIGENGSRIVERTLTVNNGSLEAIEVHDLSEIPQQQPRGSMIRWERFLPFRTIKVLLVENEDLTRHLVSALLQNCSYEVERLAYVRVLLAVVAVANGLLAWKLLEDPTNHIDIVLTEEDMPVLSGSDLLCMIMNHKMLKNIPVIMMSSHDCINLVFKCLSKGAVDFLVKPIRKNELKNLWQHVWRRCHSFFCSGISSGCVSESGTLSKKSIKSKVNDEPENYAANSDEHDDDSDVPVGCNGSENGSGTQSSWTKRAAEGESSQPMSSLNRFPDAPNSTCAQVVHVKHEKCGSQWTCVTQRKECQEQHEQLLDATEGKDLEVRVESNHEWQCGNQCENSPTHLAEAASKPFDRGWFEHQDENIIGKDRTPDTITTLQQAECRASDAPGGPSDVPQLKDGACHGSEEKLSFELTLKRWQGASDGRNAANDGHNVLRHSDSSALSKYSTASSAKQALTGNVGSCSPLDRSSVTKKTEIMCTFPSHSSAPTENEHYHLQVGHDTSLKIMAITDKQCRSSSSVNGSASGSNYGSNGHNGSETGLRAEHAVMEDGNGTASGRSGGSGADEDRVAQRAAALTKFRQKRKERCFEKKVRYQSRKKLAEQRPRVKGQFVRRTMYDIPNSDWEGGKDSSSYDFTSEDRYSDSLR
ncbi:two-component response regulator-like APRR3 [Gossypium australe]|uniref:Two-component response regulator-like APRR3 n=1 Tax=Gossypium australe TaxID=47621 RepID=A0A5B6X7B1_9ROSI|nr:two-component response regulator-like APRR3 [Gossypium australe]